MAEGWTGPWTWGPEGLLRGTWPSTMCLKPRAKVHR